MAQYGVSLPRLNKVVNLIIIRRHDMKMTTLLFVAASGFAGSTAVLAEGFNDCRLS